MMWLWLIPVLRSCAVVTCYLPKYATITLLADSCAKRNFPPISFWEETKRRTARLQQCLDFFCTCDVISTYRVQCRKFSNLYNFGRLLEIHLSKTSIHFGILKKGPRSHAFVMLRCERALITAISHMNILR